MAFECIPGWPPEAAAALDRAATPVTVRGVVRHLDLDEVERMLGVEVNHSRLLLYAGKPVILSTRLAVTPGEAQLQPREVPSPAAPPR